MSKNLGDLIIFYYLGQLFETRSNMSKNLGNLGIFIYLDQHLLAALTKSLIRHGMLEYPGILCYKNIEFRKPVKFKLFKV